MDTTTPARPAIRLVRVVVPAHDEAEVIGACLESVAVATRVMRDERPGVDAATLLVLDRCTDDTATVARALGVATTTVDHGSVGAARRAGVAVVAEAAQRQGRPPAEVLVVNTDADCVVPPRWLVDLLDLAHDHDLVQGEVTPDPVGLSTAAQTTWSDRNPAGRGSLHGANLAIRLDTYLAAGGFPAVSEQEDLLLVRAARALGARSTGGTTVVTSSRRDGRTPGGFAAYLRALDAEHDTDHDTDDDVTDPPD